MRQHRILPPLLLTTTLGTFLVSCGGTPARPAQPTKHEQETVDSKALAPVAETNEKTGPDCSDGGCITCGDAFCPRGFYCDESHAQAACQWVPTCKGSVNCDCVKSALSDACSCSERSGGTYVHCGK